MAENGSITLDLSEVQKLAETKYPIEDVLRRRCSTFAFSDRTVEVEKLQQLFEAARWAPSSHNEQPWSFIVATGTDNRADYELLLSCVAAQNRSWAQHAPVLVLSVAKRHFDVAGKVNHYSLHDVGLSTQNLTIQATALGLFVHLMAGFDTRRARELFAIPENYDPVCVIAIGYFGTPDSLPVELRHRELAPRHRRAFNEFVSSGKWGDPSELIPD